MTTNTMKLENLANELLLEVFEFLDTVRLFRAFYDLNSRFNNLLVTSIRNYHIDFRSLSQQGFNNFCQKYLPSMINRVHSFRLSDDDETPNLSELFLSCGFNFDRFIHLQSLSLYSINSVHIINKIVSQCRHLPQLTQFKMINCSLAEKEVKLWSVKSSNIRVNIFQYRFFYRMDTARWELVYPMNHIWSLPKLTHCKINRYLRDEISVVSSSIKHLCIKNMTYNFLELNRLFQHTPHLRYLHVTVKSTSEGEELQISAPLLISLKVSFNGSVNSMKKLFRQIPNLSYLTLETSSFHLNGYQWEEIFVEHLPQIKVFRFKMNIKFSDSEKEVDQLLNTFRTSYWLEEHKWFVRCDWQSYGTYNFGILYTVPYAFNQSLHLSQRNSKSTCPNSVDYWSFDNVQKLRYINGKNSLYDNSVLFSFRFSYLHHIEMNFPFNVNFWSMIPSLYHLVSLDATLCDNSAYSQLQALLDRAPRLYSLKLSVLPDLKRKELFQITNKSIRRLEFIEDSALFGHYFNKAEFSALIRSSLGRQCEVLLIGIEKQADVLDLISGMTNLRILIFKCEKTSPMPNDEFVRWIRNNQSSSISSFIQDTNQVSTFQYWIR